MSNNLLLQYYAALSKFVSGFKSFYQWLKLDSVESGEYIDYGTGGNNAVIGNTQVATFDGIGYISGDFTGWTISSYKGLAIPTKTSDSRIDVTAGQIYSITITDGVDELTWYAIEGEGVDVSFIDSSGNILKAIILSSPSTMWDNFSDLAAPSLLIKGGSQSLVTQSNGTAAILASPSENLEEEIHIDPSFDDSSEWSGWTIEDGLATRVGATSANLTPTTLNIVEEGKTYRGAYEVVVSGSLLIANINGNIFLDDSVGEHFFFFTSDRTASYRFVSGDSATTLSYNSLKEVSSVQIDGTYEHYITPENFKILFTTTNDLLGDGYTVEITPTVITLNRLDSGVETQLITSPGVINDNDKISYEFSDTGVIVNINDVEKLNSNDTTYTEIKFVVIDSDLDNEISHFKKDDNRFDPNRFIDDTGTTKVKSLIANGLLDTNSNPVEFAPNCGYWNTKNTLLEPNDEGLTAIFTKFDQLNKLAYSNIIDYYDLKELKVYPQYEILTNDDIISIYKSPNQQVFDTIPKKIGKNWYYENAQNPTTINNVNIISCLDSLTKGGACGGVPYPMLIFDELIDKFQQIDSYNQGITGRTTQEMIGNFDRDIKPIIDSAKDNYVIILGGANDGGITAQESYDNLKTISDLSKSVGATTIIFTPTGTTSSTEHNARLLEIRALLITTPFADVTIDTQEIAEAQDPSNITYFCDGLHWTEDLRQLVIDKLMLEYFDSELIDDYEVDGIKINNTKILKSTSLKYTIPVAPLANDFEFKYEFIGHQIGVEVVIMRFGSGAYSLEIVNNMWNSVINVRLRNDDDTDYLFNKAIYFTDLENNITLKRVGNQMTVLTNVGLFTYTMPDDYTIGLGGQVIYNPNTDLLDDTIINVCYNDVDNDINLYSEVESGGIELESAYEWTYLDNVQPYELSSGLTDSDNTFDGLDWPGLEIDADYSSIKALENVIPPKDVFQLNNSEDAFKDWALQPYQKTTNLDGNVINLDGQVYNLKY